jgi:glycerol-3-phosphate dehydrogenase
VLEEVRKQFTELPQIDMEAPILDPVGEVESDQKFLDKAALRRLKGRYGSETDNLLSAAQAGELAVISQTNIHWAELRWAARAEGVSHLDDLLLRRVRLGLVVEQGGMAHLERIREICQPELGWCDKRWEAEEAAYNQLWERCYSLPPRSKIPDWKSGLASQNEVTDVVVRKEHALRTKKDMWPLSIVVFLGSFAVMLAYWLLRRRVTS